MEELLELHVKMFPGREVMPVVFGHPRPERVEEENAYVARELERYPTVRGFLLTDAAWSAGELEERFGRGRFSGLKPYPTMSPRPSTEVRIPDYLPEAHIELAEERGWVIILHLPRPGRIGDPDNVNDLISIAKAHAALKLVVAHVGRAYCPGRCEDGIRRLADHGNIRFDISANCSEEVFRTVIETAGPKRLLYGSDLPITAMRAKRICEGEEYVNLVRGADWEDERTRRDPEHEDEFTFFLYEEIAAFKQAADSCGLREKDIEDVFLGNALALLGKEGDVG